MSASGGLQADALSQKGKNLSAHMCVYMCTDMGYRHGGLRATSLEKKANLIAWMCEMGRDHCAVLDSWARAVESPNLFKVLQGVQDMHSIRP